MQLEPPKNSDQPIDLELFTRLTKKRQGSRDVGAQMFCALLRSAGLDVRLVCSLQLLSFASVPTTVSPQKQKPTIRMTGSDTETGNSGNESTGSTASSIIGTGVVPKIPPPIRRFGGGAATVTNNDQGYAPVAGKASSNLQDGDTLFTVIAAKPRTFKESKYPVYWVEVFDGAYQKWLAVDPLVTRTVNKAQKLEPPASDSANDLVYAIAFDEDGCAKDVTRRYAKAYNAKTRRSRIEATKEGQRWLRRAMRMYKGIKQVRRDLKAEASQANETSRIAIKSKMQNWLRKSPPSQCHEMCKTSKIIPTTH
jgi:xeroderma pigmentosum group C-complementing protein